MSVTRTKYSAILVVISFLFMAFIWVDNPGVEGAGGSFGGGNGTQANPYVIEDAWDLQNISADLDAYYVLGNDIDANDTVNWDSGRGFDPIGDGTSSFNGSLDGRNHTITGLRIRAMFYNGLFGFLGPGASVSNVGLIAVYATGRSNVGGLVGYNNGTVVNSYSNGTVDGKDDSIGGLVGRNRGIVNHSYSTATVIGDAYRQDTYYVGGLVGYNDQAIINNSYATGAVRGRCEYIGGLVGRSDNGKVLNSHATGNVTRGGTNVGGLVGYDSQGTVSNCYATGNVEGYHNVGGLIGYSISDRVFDCYGTGSVDGGWNVGGLVGNDRQGQIIDSHFAGSLVGGWYHGGIVGAQSGNVVSNSHYNVDAVELNGGHYITLGGLFDAQYRDWYSNGKSLNISDYSTTLVPSGEHHNISNVQGMKDLLGFAGIRGYKYRLGSDVDMSGNPNIYIPYLNSGFDGANHTISNLYLNITNGCTLGLFGYVNASTIENLRVVDCNVNGSSFVGGLLAKSSSGTVANSYVTGNVTGRDSVGGLVGSLGNGIINDSYAVGIVSGTERGVGGLVGTNGWGSIARSYATVDVTADWLDVGGLVGDNTGTITDSYATGDVTGKKDNVGGLVGNNNLFITDSYSTGNVTGDQNVGGLVGINHEAISRSFSSGLVTGEYNVGGLAGFGVDATVTDCYATGKVVAGEYAGGLVGRPGGGPIVSSYSTGHVSGQWAGGLVGYSSSSIDVRDSFWDTTTSGQSTSYGGKGKTTAEMMTRSTYSNAGWNLSGVWFLIEDVTYPLLWWQDGEVPVANAGIDLIVDEDTMVSFNGSGSIDDIGIQEFNWTFVDGGHVTLDGADPTYLFNDPGVFVVTLQVTDGVGNRDTDNMTVTVNDVTAPIADAGPDQTVDEGTLVAFNGNRSSDNAGVVNFTWTIMEGTPMTLYGVEPTYRFTEPGTFEVTLNITDAAGHWNLDTMTVTVKDATAPSSVAGLDQVVDEGALVSFDGSGSSDHIGVVNYTWTFMDGATVTLHGAKPTYKFNVPGVFVVSLNVTDAAGLWNTDTVTITVIDITSPDTDAGLDQAVDEGTLVTFNGSASWDNGTIVSWTWDLKYDGQEVQLYGEAQEFTFAIPGEYTITLTATDTTGNQGTDVVRITVHDTTAPVADAGNDMYADQGLEFTLDGSASTDNVGVIEWSWSFEDGGTAEVLTGPDPTYVFKDAGEYAVKLTVTDAAGNWATDTVTVTVRDTTPPAADAGDDISVDQNEGATFDGTSSSDNVAVVNWTWKFTYDGTDHVLHGSSFTYFFEKAGTFEVTMEVRDEADNFASDPVVVHVNDITPPTAEAGLNVTVKGGAIVTFDGAASKDNVGVVNWTWTFVYKTEVVDLHGDQSEFEFDKPGVYTVTMTARDAAGNEATDTLEVTVRKVESGEETPWLLIVVVIIVVALLTVIVVWMKGRKSSA